MAMLNLTGITHGKMKRKDSTISLIGLHKRMRLVLIVVDGLWKQHGQVAVIIAGTEAFSGNELIHQTNSLHPFGKALDFRTRYFDKAEQVVIKAELKKLLGYNYDVILHKSHIHVERQKK